MNTAWLLLGFVISYSYWAIYLFRRYKNPFFPYFNKLFHSPFFPSQNFLGPSFQPHGLVQTVFYPFYFMKSQHLVSEELFRDPRLGILYILLVVLVIYLILSHFVQQIPKPKITKESVVLLLFIIVSYILWEKIYSYYRYLEVIEFLSLLAIITIVCSVIRSTRLAVLLSLLIALLIMFMTSPMHFGRITWQSSWFGVKLPANYIRADSVVLMAGNEPQSFLIPFFPSGVDFIRTQGNIYEPGPPIYPETTAYKQLVKSAILSKEQPGTIFYALETTDEVNLATVTVKQYDFKVESCQPIYTYDSQYLQKNNNYYELCRLEPQ